VASVEGPPRGRIEKRWFKIVQVRHCSLFTEKVSRNR
jgi:hypothetical protein